MADFVIEQKLFVSGIRETERSAVDRISGKCSFYQWILTKSIAYLSRFGIIKEWFTVRKNRALKTCLMNLEEIHVTSSSHKK